MSETSRNTIYAGFWIRYLATILDSLFLAIPAAISIAMGSYILGAIIAIIYKPVFESSALQATPGKALLSLQVVDSEGQRIDFKTSMIRFASSYISGCILFLGYIMAAFSSRKQTLHDKIANTFVIKAMPQEIGYFDAWVDEIKNILKTDKLKFEKRSKEEAPVKTTAEQLQELQSLYQQGLINETEYFTKRAEIINKI